MNLVRLTTKGGWLLLGLLLTASATLAPPVGEAQADAPNCQYTLGTETVVDNETQLEWQRGDSSAGNPAAANSYCDDLQLTGIGNVITLDWRLPTLLEWQSIIDDSRTNPALDPAAFPGGPSTYWTSSQQAGTTWAVQAFDGTTSNGISAQRVRCVRNAG